MSDFTAIPIFFIWVCLSFAALGSLGSDMANGELEYGYMLLYLFTCMTGFISGAIIAANKLQYPQWHIVAFGPFILGAAFFVTSRIWLDLIYPYAHKYELLYLVAGLPLLFWPIGVFWYYELAKEE